MADSNKLIMKGSYNSQKMKNVFNVFLGESYVGKIEIDTYFIDDSDNTSKQAGLTFFPETGFESESLSNRALMKIQNYLSTKDPDILIYTSKMVTSNDEVETNENPTQIPDADNSQNEEPTETSSGSFLNVSTQQENTQTYSQAKQDTQVEFDGDYMKLPKEKLEAIVNSDEQAPLTNQEVPTPSSPESPKITTCHEDPSFALALQQYNEEQNSRKPKPYINNYSNSDE